MDLAFTPYDIVRIIDRPDHDVGIVTDYSFRWTDNTYSASEVVYRVTLESGEECNALEAALARVGRLQPPFDFGDRVRMRDVAYAPTELKGLTLEVVGVGYDPRLQEWHFGVSGHPSGQVWGVRASEVEAEDR